MAGGGVRQDLSGGLGEDAGALRPQVVYLAPSRGSSIQQPTSRDFTVGESPFLDTTPVVRADEVIE
jgi:hypothetical protein